MTNFALNVIFIVLISLWCKCDGTDLYVDSSANANSAQDGTEANPCLSISACMKLANDGDTVNVKPGKGYTGPDNIGICVAPLGQKSYCKATGVKLTGYGAPQDVLWYMSAAVNAERALSISNNTITTIANMTIAGFYFHPKFSDQITDFRAAGGAIVVENTNLHLNHMIFVNNSAATGGSLGANQGKLTISNSVFRDNQALVSGGAFVIEGGSVFVRNSRFERNLATGNPATQSFGNGGAIDIRGTSKDLFEFVGGVFVNNTAAQSGGALHIQSPNFKTLGLNMTGVLFDGNIATGAGSCVSSSACIVRGGAIFASIPSATFKRCIFLKNKAVTVANNQIGEGGAVYSTDVNSVNQLGLQTIFEECEFESNHADEYGGAAYLLNQFSIFTKCVFWRNSAGMRSELFADTSNAGGALWFSALGTSAKIQSSHFYDNYVWGGWGGAVFVTDSPNPLIISDCNFTSNFAFSSYTFAAQGGALMVSHNTIIRIDHSHFANNTAAPRLDTGSGPLTLSGCGGAIYLQSANMSVLHCNFRQNLALTGQFDSGSAGGAMLLEDSSDSVVNFSEFHSNGAAGFLGYSSFASSGAAGAIMVKFSSAAIYHSYFSKNWVSVGGTRLSSGGAVAVNFGYSSNGLPDGAGVTIRHSIFDENVAFSSLCAISGAKSGSGGAIAVIGSNTPGLDLRNVTFRRNMALSRSGLLVLSYGGALSISVGSNVTGAVLTFESNFALNGLGNDIGVLGGDTSSLNNNVHLSDSTFNTSVTVSSVTLAKLYLARESARLCSELTAVFKGGNLQHKGIPSTAETVPLSAVVRKEAKHEVIKTKKMQLHHKIFQMRHSDMNERRLQELYDSEIVAQDVHAEQGQRLLSASPMVSGIPSFYHYPSILVVTGRIKLHNPKFNGEYHVFFGDFLQLLIDDSTPAGNGCEAFIFGDIVQQKLAISAFRAQISIFNEKHASLEFGKLMLINSTMNVANHINILGNSSLVDSAITRDTSIVNPHLGMQMPRIVFYSELYTGFDLLDFTQISQLNPYTIQKLITFSPVVTLDGCIIDIMKKLELNIPRVNSVTPSKDAFLLLNLRNKAYLNITAKSVVDVVSMVHMQAENDNDTAVVNNGKILLDGFEHTLVDKFDPDKAPVVVNDDINGDKGNIKEYNSLTSVLTVNGQFIQTDSGRLSVTLNQTFQTNPVLNLVSNESFLGELSVSFIGRPDILFYDASAPSRWEVVSYKNRKRNPLGSVALDAPFGLGFTKVVETHVNTTVSPPVTTYVDAYQISSMSCRDSIPYSAYTEPQYVVNSLYPCFLCLSNSSCSYCQNGGCMDSSSNCLLGGGVQYQGTCCEANCHTPNGKCTASSGNSVFSCVCNAFYTGSSCSELSNISIVVITLSGALVVVVVILIYNYRKSRGKKTQVLEELRQGLLYDKEGGGKNLDNINEAYLQSLQQGLILKDVSVKFNEIHIEKQVGEGSFGVVYKATFRGASVAVKRMRPVFVEITNKEIEEFNKEAYMMSRLRHPNIVLVMGISYVEPEVMKFPKKSRFGGDAGGEDDEEFGPPVKAKAKAPLQKTVCIVTEFLEQGSLADILYGPQRLSPDIWTYDLILTCALQAARGMLYLHSHTPPICHRDLKSSNLVVDDHWVVKVTDFGMSRIIPENVIDIETGARPNDGTPQAVEITKSQQDRLARIREKEHRVNALDWEGRSNESSAHASDGDGFGSAGNSAHSAGNIDLSTPLSLSKLMSAAGPGKDRNGQEMTSNLGTTAWCAPELLTASTTARYSVKVDVYSFGIVLWELWERKRPYEDLASRFDIMDAIRSGKRPPIGDACPPALRSLIQRCWQGDPTRRPMFQYIVRYLKDELARVKRSRERMPSMGGLNNAGSSFGSSGNGGGKSWDTLGGRISSMMPWNRGSDASEEPRERSVDTAPSPQVSIPPSHAENDRAPLLNTPDYNYLAASPAVVSGSYLRAQGLQGAPQAVPRARPSTTPPAAASPLAQNQRQPVWRDKYVMKMSGWQPSQPDTGLPPSAVGGSLGSTSTLSKSIENNNFFQRAMSENLEDEEVAANTRSNAHSSTNADAVVDSAADAPAVNAVANRRMPSNTEI